MENIENFPRVSSRQEEEEETTTGPHSRKSAKRQPLPTNRTEWTIRRKDLECAIKYSGNSSPGPDGVPFKAWRTLGKLGVSILYGVANSLEQPDNMNTLPEAYHDETQSHSHHYNESTLVCLAKKARASHRRAPKHIPQAALDPST